MSKNKTMINTDVSKHLFNGSAENKIEVISVVNKEPKNEKEVAVISKSLALAMTFRDALKKVGLAVALTTAAVSSMHSNNAQAGEFDILGDQTVIAAPTDGSAMNDIEKLVVDASADLTKNFTNAVTSTLGGESSADMSLEDEFLGNNEQVTFNDSQEKSSGMEKELQKMTAFVEGKKPGHINKTALSINMAALGERSKAHIEKVSSEVDNTLNEHDEHEYEQTGLRI